MWRNELPGNAHMVWRWAEKKHFGDRCRTMWRTSPLTKNRYELVCRKCRFGVWKEQSSRLHYLLFFRGVIISEYHWIWLADLRRKPRVRHGVLLPEALLWRCEIRSKGYSHNVLLVVYPICNRLSIQLTRRRAIQVAAPSGLPDFFGISWG